MYLNDWKDTGFMGLVADFSGIYNTIYEFGATECPIANVSFWEAELERDQWKGIDVLLASYGHKNYSGDAFVLFKKDGKLYEVNAGHRPYYGLEGQWEPEETTVESLLHRLNAGNLGNEDYSGNKFANELRAVLGEIEI
jgi:hypothetical protein